MTNESGTNECNDCGQMFSWIFREDYICPSCSEKRKNKSEDWIRADERKKLLDEFNEKNNDWYESGFRVDWYESNKSWIAEKRKEAKGRLSG